MTLIRQFDAYSHRISILVKHSGNVWYLMEIVKFYLSYASVLRTNHKHVSQMSVQLVKCELILPCVI